MEASEVGGCSGETDAFAEFLTAHRAVVEPLEIEVGAAVWDANITGTEEDEARAADAQKRLNKVYADPKDYDFLTKYPDAGLSALDLRQKALLTKAYLSQQMSPATIDEIVDIETRVESIYNNHRGEINGKSATENELRQVLAKSDDTDARRAAWDATKTVGERVEKDVRALVNLRNREARRLGFADYYIFALGLQELEADSLFELLGEAERATNAAWQFYKSGLDARLSERFAIPAENLEAWHYGDPFFQEPQPSDLNLDAHLAGKDLAAVTGDFFAEIGLPVADILQRSDLYEKPGKSQHAFETHVGRFEDVRVLCNCTATERWMGTMLHEFGHAAYDKYLPDPASADGDALPFFLREVAHTAATEAIAMLMGRFVQNAAWLSRWADVPRDEARKIEAQARREQGEGLLIFVRWCLVMTHFERAMYQNPDQDLNALWWDLVERFQNVRRPANRNKPDWAAKLHVALAPVYYQNYLLGEMFASQLLNTLRQRVLPDDADGAKLVSTPALGEYLRREVFAKGASLSWNDLVQSATGEPLQPKYLLRDMLP